MNIRPLTVYLFVTLILLLSVVADGSIQKKESTCIEKVQLGLNLCLSGASNKEKASCAIESKRQLENRCGINKEFSRLMTDKVIDQLFGMEI